MDQANPLLVEDIQTVPVRAGASPRSSLPESLVELKGYLDAGREGTLGRLGHYDVLEVLGEGGFGIVVKAFDQTLQRFVAIKVLSPRFAATSPPRKYFLREARSAAKIRHEHVVQIHGVEESPLPYLVMEYIEGETLQDRLDRAGPLEPADVVRLGQQIAAGLAAAHATGLIHRDIKPSNILLEKSDLPRVKITDFGIARTTDDASLTQSGFIVGTPMYMAPEQANGEPVDHRADLFSLGSLLYTLAGGRPPFRAPTAMAVLKRVAEDTPRSIREVNPAVGAGLAAVIDRLHAKSPADRFQTAREVADALANCLADAMPAPRSMTRRLLLAVGVAATLLAAWALGLSSGRVAESGEAARTHVAEPARPAGETAAAKINPANSSNDAEAKPALPVSPWTEWEQAVAAMPVGDQVPAVSAKLRVLNPDFDDRHVTYKIEGKVVSSLTIRSSDLKNLAPLRALKHLRELRLESYWRGSIVQPSQLKDLNPLRGMRLEGLHVLNSQVSDLTPLVGMPLKELCVWDARVSDLAPLRGLGLTSLNCGSNPIHDLAPLTGMPLSCLCINISEVADLRPLAGMKLTTLEMERTRVTDLTPIVGMPLEVLRFQGSPIVSRECLRRLAVKELTLDFERARDLEVLQSLKSLTKINSKEPSEFFASVGG